MTHQIRTIETKHGKIAIVVWPDESISINALNAKGHTVKKQGWIRLSAGAMYGVANWLHESGWVKRTAKTFAKGNR